ncbi:AEC family transporter [Rhodovulum sulfidophilum]|uniref:AEC family transporter n=1 Tax=Rhodovulum sulfidophilum TaxID=35806 RepID=UPI0009530DE9|nr:AEC family transporter [Rhodovulum sulfidophilum]MBL3551615.1 AEC family transporter [Rhodovulum sulfidophilum]MBL3561017.1 AEC family transporter [Rhodovulum sulfidophilum]MBL3585830.1 AEC family transporter [Rhodovulum sulfidophilum]MCE8418071.1 AEC family transporter [Rhodovulum sulfidophilum]MCE8441360.1 AEC family transporter [Rhodovulum sulfidophilum]
MNLLLTVTEIVAPVFLLAAVGFLWVRFGNEYRVQFVTQLTMTLSVPCLIFTALMKTEIEPQALTALSLAAAAAYGAVTILCLAVVRLARLDRRTYLSPIIFGNTGNIGLPLALFAFGERGFDYAVVVFAVMAIYSFTFGVWLVAGGGSPLKALKEPLVWATALGGLFLWQGWQTPAFLTNALSLIGQIAVPLMLITMGVAIARLHPGHLPRAVWLSLVKLAICLGVAAGIGLWFGLDRVALAVLVLQISTPVAVTSYLLAEKYGADADAVAGLVVVSTLLSMLALPLTLAVLL